MQRTQELNFTKEEITQRRKVLAEVYRIYPNYESFLENLKIKLDKASKEVKEGKGIPMKVAMAELEEEFRKNGCF